MSPGMLSPSGRCKTLDVAADGYVSAEAAGVMLLTRLADLLSMEAEAVQNKVGTLKSRQSPSTTFPPLL